MLGTFRFLRAFASFRSEAPPPHSGECNHALAQTAAATLPQLSRPMRSGHHICMEPRLRRTPPARLLQQLITSENVSGVNEALLFTIYLHSRSSNENVIRTSTQSTTMSSAGSSSSRGSSRHGCSSPSNRHGWRSSRQGCSSLFYSALEKERERLFL